MSAEPNARQSVVIAALIRRLRAELANRLDQQGFERLAAWLEPPLVLRPEEKVRS